MHDQRLVAVAPWFTVAALVAAPSVGFGAITLDAEPELVADIATGTDSSSPTSLTDVNGTLFFRAATSSVSTELWKSNGTEAGTELVKNINPSGSSTPQRMLAVGDTLYFMATDGTNGSELWKSNGTDAGTVMIDRSGGTGINFGTGSASPNGLVVFNNQLFFTATDGSTGRELYTVNASGQAEKVVDIGEVSGGDEPSSISASAGIVVMNGLMYFSGITTATGFELWSSNGTAAGTTMVSDFRAGDLSSSPRGLTPTTGGLFFSAVDDLAGGSDTGYRELFFYNPTGTNNGLVEEINPDAGAGGLSTDPMFTQVGNQVFFVGDDGGGTLPDSGRYGRELWVTDVTDPTSANTRPVTIGTNKVGDNEAEYLNSNFTELAAYDNFLYFGASEGEVNGAPAHYHLYRTDGTTVDQVVNFDDGNFFAEDITDLLVYANLLFFVVQIDDDQGVVGTQRDQIWAYDGSTPSLVHSTEGTGNITNLTISGGRLYFTAGEDDTGVELWSLTVPEPGALALMGAGALAMLYRRRMA